MAALFLFILVAFSIQAAELSPDEIVRKSVAVNEKDWLEAPLFSHADRTIERKDDQTTDRTFAVVMMEGSPYRRLIAVNGQPLSPVRQRQEDQKEARERARRRAETAAERDVRIRKYQKERDQDHLLMVQMAVAFTFHLVGEEIVEGRPCYILDAEPKPDYKPVNHEAKVLTGMRGRIWIDKEQFHWAKVQAEVVRPVSFGGFVAKVAPGTKFVLETEPVNGEIWQPKEFSVQVCASILFWQHNSSTTEQFSDYRSGNVAANGSGRSASTAAR